MVHSALDSAVQKNQKKAKVEKDQFRLHSKVSLALGQSVSLTLG